MSDPDRTVRLVIRGRVQGVGFRWFVVGEARARDVGGWVRNRRDGAVEAVIAGPPDVVEDMIEACRRGPRSSRVERVDVLDAADSDAPDEEPGEAFTIRPTV